MEVSAGINGQQLELAGTTIWTMAINRLDKDNATTYISITVLTRLR
jgi:hypothetical protein